MDFKRKVLIWGMALFGTSAVMVAQFPKIILGTWTNRTNQRVALMERGIPSDIQHVKFLNKELVPHKGNYDAVFDFVDKPLSGVTIKLKYDPVTQALTGYYGAGNFVAKNLPPLHVKPAQTVFVDGILEGPKLENSSVSIRAI